MQRGEQTDDAERNALGRFREAVLLGDIGVGQSVKAARVLHDEAALDQPRKMLACRSDFGDFHRAEQASLTQKIEQARARRGRSSGDVSRSRHISLDAELM